MAKPRSDKPIKTTCPYCGTGCGVVMSPARDGWAVGGDPDHGANFGNLCSKGAALGDVLVDDGRLTTPSVDGVEVRWSDAIDQTAKRLRHIIDTYGPHSVAFYVSGQLLTEDYYVANKLLKGFIGSPHIDTNSRLCMASTVVGHKRAFGEDVVPGAYEDIDEADLVVLTGSNLAWCHPILHRRLREARAKRGTKVVVIDPRRTDSCDDADFHLPLKPGTDVALFNGLLCYLADQGIVDHPYIKAHVNGFEETLAAARADAPSLSHTAQKCGLEVETLKAFFDLFVSTERTVTIFSQGVNQSAQGSDKVNAIINCHLATGRIARPGMGPFSVTGQPNAMGGREVGGLANQLAAHMDPNNPAHIETVKRFWKAPSLRQGEGLKAIDMFKAMDEGRIKAVWVMATNPAVSLPDSGMVRRALEKCELVIASDVVPDTDTLKYADIVLPAAAWGEKTGTVTNSERRISRQRGFKPAPGQAKPDWWIMTKVAHAMGWKKAFNYKTPVDVYREHAALSAYRNEGARQFNIGAHAKISLREYDEMQPFQWPLTKGQSLKSKRLYGDGKFSTPDGRANMVAVGTKALKAQATQAYPLLLNTGRYRDQWHTMTRTGTSPRLSTNRTEPLVDIHPRDAERFGVSDGGLAELSNERGTIVMRVQVTEAQTRGTLFAPIHWTDQMASEAIVSKLVAPHVDPLSGQPESKATPITLRPFEAAWSGLVISRKALALPQSDYWCRYKVKGAWVYEIVGKHHQSAVTLFETLSLPGTTDRLEVRDDKRGLYRAALMGDGVIHATLHIDRDRPQLARQWMADRFTQNLLDDDERIGLLAGRPAGADAKADRTICACYGVGLVAIQNAIANGTATTVAEVGSALNAGTGCGSCVPEIRSLLADTPTDHGTAQGAAAA
ncbi:MAG: molybdopterin-dependent oxidoreductase [Alphaproteobacteria bacterium]